MALVETRMLRTFRCEMPDALAEMFINCMNNSDCYPSKKGLDPEFDQAWDIVVTAFEKWRETDDALDMFEFDETADCVLGGNVIHGFEIIPESKRYDGTPIIE